MINNSIKFCQVITEWRGGVEAESLYNNNISKTESVNFSTYVVPPKHIEHIKFDSVVSKHYVIPEDATILT